MQHYRRGRSCLNVTSPLSDSCWLCWCWPCRGQVGEDEKSRCKRSWKRRWLCVIMLMNVSSADSFINDLSPSSKIALRPGSVSGGCGRGGVLCSQCQSRCFGQQRWPGSWRRLWNRQQTGPQEEKQEKKRYSAPPSRIEPPYTTCNYECCTHRKWKQWWEGVSRGHLVGAVLLHSSWRCVQVCPNLQECLDSDLHSGVLDQALQKVGWFHSHK